MKNKLTLIICVMIMLVPAVLAIILYKPKQPEIIQDPEGVSVVTVTDSLSNVFTVTDKDEIKLLTELANGASTPSIPDAVYRFNSFVISFTRGESSASYRFYMSADMPDQVYFKDENDVCYKADSLKARAFMEKSYAVSLYDTTIPTLTVGTSATVISPVETVWNYSTVDGKYIPVNVPSKGGTYNIDDISKKTLNISFSRRPSNAVITVFDGGAQLVSYMLDGFNGISVKEAKYYTIRINATWNEEEGQNSYGTATYEFNAYLMPDPEFSFTASELTQGAVIGITVKNARADGVSAQCPDALGVTPVFYNDGTDAFAYLPTSYLTEPGEYTVRLEYDGQSFEQTVTVKEYKFNSKTYTNAASVINSVFSAENRATEEAIINAVCGSDSAGSRLSGNEKPGYPTRRTEHKTGYGLYVTLKATGEQLRHDGADYDVPKGSEVKAILTGTVAYVGEDAIHGGIIVIDHGFGARSWYCRVDTSSVSVGQSVIKGDVIAVSNDSGFGDNSRVHLGFSVGSTFVSPLTILDTGLPR